MAALSPIITTMFANSPLYEGAIGRERSHRGVVWLKGRGRVCDAAWAGRPSKWP